MCWTVLPGMGLKHNTHGDNHRTMTCAASFTWPLNPSLFIRDLSHHISVDDFVMWGMIQTFCRKLPLSISIMFHSQSLLPPFQWHVQLLYSILCLLSITCPHIQTPGMCCKAICWVWLELAVDRGGRGLRLASCQISQISRDKLTYVAPCLPELEL